MRYAEKCSYIEAVQFSGSNFDEVLNWIREQDLTLKPDTERLVTATFGTSPQTGMHYMVIDLGNDRLTIISPGDYLTLECGIERRTRGDFEAFYVRA